MFGGEVGSAVATLSAQCTEKVVQDNADRSKMVSSKAQAKILQ